MHPLFMFPLYAHRTIVFGPPSRNRYAVIFFICGMLIWAYPFYFIRVSEIFFFLEL